MLKSFFLVIILLTVAVDLPADALPQEKEGLFPIHVPEYNGVEQLLVLSNRWVVVVTVNTSDVIQEIHRLSGGQSEKYLNRWIESQKKEKLDWYSIKEYSKIFDKYVIEARENSGERLLDNKEYYTITSSTDPNYSKPQHPLRVTRFIQSLDEEIIPGEGLMHYAHDSYLEFPEPMKSGNEYTIKLMNGKEVTFLYDEFHTVSRSIKINQVGYLPNSGKKFAYVGNYLHEFGPLDLSHADEFMVVNAETGDIALKGKLKLRAKNPPLASQPGKQPQSKKLLLTGEDTYEMDLSGIKEEGEYFITIPGVGRSWTFRYSPDVYGEVFYISARGLFHQRSGQTKKEPFTAWEKEAGHTDPVYESEDIQYIPAYKSPKGYNRFDVIGATTDTNQVTEDAIGGWYDAADWDKNIYHYANVFDLLYAYEISPDKFTDGQLNIPESGNGIPDILDEAEYGLRVWKKSQRADGGVSGGLETWTHPKFDDTTVKYSYSQRTRWSSLIYAAAAAQLAHLLMPFDKDTAKEYADTAVKAYHFGVNHQNSLGKVTIHAAEQRGKGKKYTLQWEETETPLVPFLIHAKLRLAILFDDDNYLDGIPKLLKDAPQPYEWPYSIKDFSPWLYYSLFHPKIEGKFPKLLINKWKGYYTSTADRYVSLVEKMPYRKSWPKYQNYWMSWGASTMTNYSKALLIAYTLNPEKKYLDAAIVNFDYSLGANPLGMSWTTGLGFVYPVVLQHSYSHDDDIKDPVPGITLYGITEGYFRSLQDHVWQRKNSDQKSVKFLKKENWEIPIFRKWSAHPTLNVAQNEFTIHETMSGVIFSSAMLMPGHWMPSQALKNRKPRKENLLFGYWYLP